MTRNRHLPRLNRVLILPVAPRLANHMPPIDLYVPNDVPNLHVTAVRFRNELSAVIGVYPRLTQQDGTRTQCPSRDLKLTGSVRFQNSRLGGHNFHLNSSKKGLAADKRR